MAEQDMRAYKSRLNLTVYEDEGVLEKVLGVAPFLILEVLEHGDDSPVDLGLELSVGGGISDDPLVLASLLEGIASMLRQEPDEEKK